jgi:hypothetical protein
MFISKIDNGGVLPRMLGINESTVIKWENGKWNPKEKYQRVPFEFITQIGQ